MTASAPSLAGKAVGIWGLGREGMSMARAAAAAGAARIDVVDEAPEGRLPPEAGAIPNLTIWRGPTHLDRLRRCDIVFMSPGVGWHKPQFAELRDSGISVSNAAEWFLSRHHARTIGVTGTKGKSTTASFIAHLLNQVGFSAVVAGNIGTPLSDLQSGGSEIVVAELSSQQCALLGVSPSVAVVTNLYQDHLDWHGNVDGYYAAKANIFRHGARSLVSTTEVLDTLHRYRLTPLPSSVKVIDNHDRQSALSAPVPSSGPMAYPHNVINARLAALAVTEMTGREVNADELHHAMSTFGPLPHRLELVRDDGRRRWIDDTLATTGESVVAALTAMAPRDSIALIVGGMDRDLDYRQIDDYLLRGARRVTLIQGPTNGASIGRRYASAHPDRTHWVDGLKEAVELAASLPEVNVVLLSPGSASYDSFPNFEAKAAAYRDYIDALQQT